jgi:hypothetical protein
VGAAAVAVALSLIIITIIITISSHAPTHAAGLPFALYAYMGWMTVPAVLVTTIMCATIENMATQIENPLLVLPVETLTARVDFAGHALTRLSLPDSHSLSLSVSHSDSRYALVRSPDHHPTPRGGDAREQVGLGRGGRLML